MNKLKAINSVQFSIQLITALLRGTKNKDVLHEG